MSSSDSSPGEPRRRIGARVRAALTVGLPNGFFVTNNSYEYVLGGLGAVLSGRLAPDRDPGHGREFAERHAA